MLAQVAQGDAEEELAAPHHRRVGFLVLDQLAQVVGGAIRLAGLERGDAGVEQRVGGDRVLRVLARDRLELGDGGRRVVDLAVLLEAGPGLSEPLERLLVAVGRQRDVGTDLPLGAAGAGQERRGA